MPVKQNLKEHFDHGKLDLSMMGLMKVPVKDIAAIPKATSLDLSNNGLKTIGKGFCPSLSHLVQLDLSENQLVELPQDIGLMVNLKHLDLYSNQLTSLPLSFGNLKALRWLDLKQNPLMPKLAQIAGPCLDSAQCASAAKNVVELLAMMNEQVEVEKQHRLEQRQKQLEENERKAQELKKTQQLLKKKNRKVRKDSSDQIKSADDSENGYLNDNDEELSKDGIEGGSGDDVSLQNSKNIDNGSYNKIFPDSTKVNTKKASVVNQVIQFCRTLTKIIVISTLLCILGLFILNLLDENYYTAARKQIIKVRNEISGYLPKTVTIKFNKGYVTSRKFFWRHMNKIGKLVLLMIQNLQDWYEGVSMNENVQAYFEQFKSGWQVLWIRISEIYRTFWVEVR